MASISCIRSEFDAMCVELSERLESCAPEEAVAGLKCLALAIVGMDGSADQKAAALATFVGLGKRAEKLGLVSGGASVLLIGDAVSHEVSAGEFLGMGPWSAGSGQRSALG
jgi:hypothetical protein